MNAMDELREALETAMADGVLVGIERIELGEAEELGYVAGVGSVLLALHRVAETIHLDGLSIFRLADVTDLADPHPQADFVASALRLRGEVPGEPPRLDLSGWAGALEPLVESEELVSIHDEADEEEGDCRIGRLLAVDGHIAHLLEIDPDATWSDEPSEIELATVTRVDLGGGYEAALRLVGGPPPPPRLDLR
jgi:hypothetical protein